MKRTIVALKLYLGSLAIGLFIVGWALVARTDSAKASTQSAQSASRQIVVVQPGATSPAGLAPLPDLPPIPDLPRAPIRTRTS
jgi:hypothetical protein